MAVPDWHLLRPLPSRSPEAPRRRADWNRESSRASASARGARAHWPPMPRRCRAPRPAPPQAILFSLSFSPQRQRPATLVARRQHNGSYCAVVLAAVAAGGRLVARVLPGESGMIAPDCGAAGVATGLGNCVTGTLITANFGLSDLTLNSALVPCASSNPCGKFNAAVNDRPGLGSVSVTSTPLASITGSVSFIGLAPLF